MPLLTLLEGKLPDALITIVPDSEPDVAFRNWVVESGYDNPNRTQMFSSRFPVYTVTHIDHAQGIATLSDSDGSSQQLRLDSWGPFKEGHPVIGSKVQLLP